MLEWSPKDVRSEIKRLKSCIHEIEDKRIAPVDDRWHELVMTDLDAARAFGIDSGREAATAEVYTLWAQIDHSNDTLHGRRPRGVTLN